MMLQPTEDTILRDVEIDDHRLQVWETGTYDHRGCSRLAYRLSMPDGWVVFEGDDFAGSPMHAVDSDDTLRGLLSFLTLRPGDTDADYFQDYTPAQLAWTDGHAENLSMWADDEARWHMPDWPGGMTEVNG